MAAPPIQPWFWELLSSAQRSLRSLCRQLEALPRERLRAYRATFDDAKASVDPYLDWNEASPHITDWPSEDGADDFAAWVVVQGREFYERVLQNPGRADEFLDLFRETEMRRRPELAWDNRVDQPEYRGNQRADTIATSIYRARFGTQTDE